MALSAFDDKSKVPKAADLEKMLGRTWAHWINLIEHAASEYPPLEEKWNFAGEKWGWAFRMKQKKRTILYLTPGNRYFMVGFVLGEKAVKAAHDGTLPDSILAEIDGARKYAEGRGVRLEIRNKKDVDSVKKLTAIKMAN